VARRSQRVRDMRRDLVILRLLGLVLLLLLAVLGARLFA
jgi:hypothetical protein